MNNKDVYKIWAPTGEKWVDWVRPVPFILINEELTTDEVYDFSIPNIYYMNELDSKTALFIDTQGYSGIKEGIALAKIGYRPIPVYNGTYEPKGTAANVNSIGIPFALVWGASRLKNIEIKKDAMPAFLLDSNRMSFFRKEISVFDNSWDLYHQDVPSGKYLKENGVEKILVKGERFNRDLKKILYNYQKVGIKIFYTDGYSEAKFVKLRRPAKRYED